MYVIGGWLGSGTYASKDVYVLDLDKLHWTLVNTNGEVIYIIYIYCYRYQDLVICIVLI